MADYDLAADIKPAAATAAGADMDGTVFCTVNTDQHKAVVFGAAISANAAFNATSWVMQHSDDNSNWSAVGADDPIIYAPKTLNQNQTLFHAGYRGKKQYVRAAFNAGGAQTGQVVAWLGHAMRKPVNYNAIEV